MADRDLWERAAATGAVELPTLTDEELASIHANEGMPLPLPALRSLSEGTRDAVLSTALRSLVVRGLVQPPTPEDAVGAGENARIEVRALGNLDAILGMRRASRAVVFVGQASYAAVLHGVRDEESVAFLVERMDDMGFHHFTLRTVESAVETIVRVADPELRTPSRSGSSRPLPPGPIDDVIRSSTELDRGVTRIDAWYADDLRKSRTSIVVRLDATFVITSEIDVAPARAQVEVVDAEGLHDAVRSAITVPG
jgi:hypothetical protein